MKGMWPFISLRVRGHVKAARSSLSDGDVELGVSLRVLTSYYMVRGMTDNTLNVP